MGDKIEWFSFPKLNDLTEIFNDKANLPEGVAQTGFGFQLRTWGNRRRCPC